MKTVKLLINVFIFLAVILIPLTAMAEDAKEEQRDKVILKNGSVSNGKILDVTYAKVKLAHKSIDASQVSKIVYYDTPSDYIEALDMIENEQYDRALFKLKLALETPGVRDWIKLYVDIQRVNILWKQEKWSDARKKCTDINSGYKDHFFLADTSWKIPLTFMKQGKFDNAETAFDTIYQDSRFADADLHWQAWFWKIFTLELRNNYKESYQQYLRLAQEAYRKIPTPAKTALNLNKPLPDDVAYLGELYLEATFRGNLNMALSGKLDQARQEFTDLSKKASKTLKNIGEIGLSICYVVEVGCAEEITSEIASKLDDARLRIAENFIFTAKTANRRAELLYWAGRASLLMDDTTQARAYFEMITLKYQDSLIARSAEKELAALKKDDEVVDED